MHLICRVSMETRRRVSVVLRQGIKASFVSTDVAVASMLAAEEQVCIVWELSPAMARTSLDVPHELLEALDVPILLFCQASPATIDAVIKIMKSRPNVISSFVGTQSLEGVIAELVHQLDQPSADVEIIRAIPRHPAASLAAVAAIAGRRRVSVAEFAQMARQPKTGIQELLSRSTSLTTRQLLSQMTCLHTAWRCGVLEWPVKKAATAAGFATSDALNHYTRRNAGFAPAAISGPAIFADNLEKLAARFLS